MNKFALVLSLLLLLGACTSSGPKTQYYSLFADKQPAIHAINNKTLAFGVGPIEMPEYVDHSGIVSATGSNKLIVSGYNAWAGELKENMARVLTSNFSTAFELDHVWAFPWGAHNKPDYRLRFVFEDFSGVKGGEVRVLVRWSLTAKQSKQNVMVGKELVVKQTQSASYNDYVAALNTALNELSDIVAAKVAEEVNHL